jgi:hypothetical protein
MDLSKQFSFTDFLAYFFPGSFAALGLYLLLLLSPLQKYLAGVSFDITTGLVFLIFSYIIGVILSPFSSGVVKFFEKSRKFKSSQNVIPSDLFPDEILKGFREIMGIAKDEKIMWSRSHYRVCLMLVTEKMPLVAQRVDRQRNVALFRRNLISPLIVWGLTGSSWGIWHLKQSFINWGISLIIGSVLLTVILVGVTINRMHDGEKTETRETLSGFLAGYKLGVFTKAK